MAALGFDNLPVAKFRFEQDAGDYLSIEFTDLSYYEPEDWYWDFGDNTSSQDTCPSHTFSQSGIYEVCLTVSNSNGEHSHCRTLNLGITALEGPELSMAVEVFPNPVRDYLTVSLLDYLPGRAMFRLYSGAGQLLLEKPVKAGVNQFDLSTLPLGMYYYEVRDSGYLLRSGKVVVSN